MYYVLPAASWEQVETHRTLRSDCRLRVLEHPPRTAADDRGDSRAMNIPHNWRSSLVLVAFVTSLVRPALAQDRIAAEALEPAPMVQGSVLSVYGARALPAKGYSLSVLGSQCLWQR